MAASQHYCIFEVAGDFFAASTVQVREITSQPSYAKVPCPSSVLAGVWHEGSEFLPMLRLPFHNSTVSPSDTAQVLIIHGPSGRWGLLVDHVHKIDMIECSQGAEAASHEWSTALMGMSNWNGKSVRVLNLDGLYRLSETILENDWNHQLASVNKGRVSCKKEVSHE